MSIRGVQVIRIKNRLDFKSFRKGSGMRRSTFLLLLLTLLTFGIYFYYFEPLLNSIWQRFIVFMVIIYLLHFIRGKVELHIDFLKKRMDKHASVWLVIGLFSLIIIVGTVI